MTQSENKSQFDPHPYQFRKDFKLIEAAFLWLEVDPSEELTEDPRIKSMKKAIGEASYESSKSVRDREIKSILKDVSEGNDQAIRYKFGSSVLDQFKSAAFEADRRLLSCTNKFIGLPEPTREDVERLFPLYSKNDIEDGSILSRSELKEIAENWGDRPRFLYPDKKPTPSLSENQVHNNSFHCFVKAYCKLQELNIEQREGLAQEIMKKLDMDGIDHPQADTMRKIIKQVQGQSINNAGRAKPKK